MLLPRFPRGPRVDLIIKRVSIHAPAGAFDHNSGLQAGLVPGRHGRAVVGGASEARSRVEAKLCGNLIWVFFSQSFCPELSTNPSVTFYFQ